MQVTLPVTEIMDRLRGSPCQRRVTKALPATRTTSVLQPDKDRTEFEYSRVDISLGVWGHHDAANGVDSSGISRIEFLPRFSRPVDMLISTTCAGSSP